MDAVQRATEGHLVGHAWVKRRCEDAAVLCAAHRSLCIQKHDRVILSERARQVEPTSEIGDPHR